MPIIIKTLENDTVLEEDQEEVIKKGLRLLILVGNTEDGLIAAKILAFLA